MRRTEVLQGIKATVRVHHYPDGRRPSSTAPGACPATAPRARSTNSQRRTERRRDPLRRAPALWTSPRSPKAPSGLTTGPTTEAVNSKGSRHIAHAKIDIGGSID